MVINLHPKLPMIRNMAQQLPNSNVLRVHQNRSHRSRQQRDLSNPGSSVSQHVVTMPVGRVVSIVEGTHGVHVPDDIIVLTHFEDGHRAVGEAIDGSEGASKGGVTSSGGKVIEDGCPDGRVGLRIGGWRGSTRSRVEGGIGECLENTLVEVVRVVLIRSGVAASTRVEE